MERYIAIIILAFVCSCSYADGDINNVEISTDKDGNVVYDVEIDEGKSIGVVPTQGELQSLKEVGELAGLQVGQVWTYKTRKGEENSLVTILRLEKNINIGGIVHVSLNGLKIANPAAPDGLTKEASHLPFAEEAIKKSVVALQLSVEVGSAYMEGYEMWRSAFEQGKAGVFTISLIEGVEFLEGMFRRVNTQQGTTLDAGKTRE